MDTFTELERGLIINSGVRDFQGGPVVKNPPANAGGHGFSPCGLGRFHSAAGQLSPCTATEAQTPESSCSATREATALRGPCTATRESLCAAMKTQHNQKETHLK